METDGQLMGGEREGCREAFDCEILTALDDLGQIIWQSQRR